MITSYLAPGSVDYDCSYFSIRQLVMLRKKGRNSVMRHCGVTDLQPLSVHGQGD